MKHHNGKERRSVIIQFSLWFLAACALVALTAYSYARIDSTETESLRSNLQESSSMQEATEGQRNARIKVETASMAIYPKFEGLSASAESFASDAGPRMGSVMDNLETAQLAYSQAIATGGYNQADSILSAVTNQYHKTVSELLRINSVSYNEVVDLRQRIQEDDCQDRLNRYMTALSQANQTIVTLGGVPIAPPQ